MSTTNLIDELRDRLLSRTDPQARPKAERDFARLKGLKIGSVGAALEVAGDPARPAEDRSLAAWCLGQLGDAGIAPPLVDLLAHETSEAVVWEMSKAIATSAAPSDRPRISSRLEAILDHSAEVGKRKALVFALGLLGQQSAIPTLSRVLHTFEAPLDLREQAAEALGNVPGPAAAGALLGGLKDSPLALAIAVVRALVANGDSRQVEHLEEFVVTVEALLNEARIALEEFRGRGTSR